MGDPSVSGARLRSPNDEGGISSLADEPCRNLEWVDDVSDLEPLTGTRFGVIADAHIHPGKTPPFPERLLDAFHGVDGIIALGDMGEASGLDVLARLAPVYAVAGEDDAAGDARINGERRLFSLGGLAVG